MSLRTCSTQDDALYVAFATRYINVDEVHARLLIRQVETLRYVFYRINLTLYKLDRVMEGALDEILTALYEHDIEQRIKQQMQS